MECTECRIKAEYDAESFVIEAQSAVAHELTYQDCCKPQNSHEINEAAMSTLTSIRHYLAGIKGASVPGVNTAYLYSFATKKNDGTYVLNYEE